jgi:V8-like Glu-specific endopeptidase
MKIHVLAIGVVTMLVGGYASSQEARQLREGRLQVIQLDRQSVSNERRAVNVYEPTLSTYAENLEQLLLLRQPREPKSHDEIAGPVRLVLGGNHTNRVMPREEIGDVLDGIGTSKGLPTKAVVAAKSELADLDSACTTSLLETLGSAQLEVTTTPLQPPMDSSSMGPDERLYRLLTEAGMPSGESAKSVSKLRQLEVAWRSVLNACFVPPTQATNFKAVAERVGVFIVPNRPPFCSGTLIADGFVLTARHCFYSKNASTPHEDLVSSLVFSPADGSKPFKIDAKQFDKTEAFVDPLQDQLLIKVEVTGRPLPPLEQAGLLASFTDTKGDLQGVTQMFMFGAHPLARALDPTNYPNSIVGSSRPGCFPIFKTDQCFTHMCGAMPGTSGASMFTLHKSSIFWAGQHSAAEGMGLYCAGPSSRANFALRANRPEINALLKQ